MSDLRENIESYITKSEAIFNKIIASIKQTETVEDISNFLVTKNDLISEINFLLVSNLLEELQTANIISDEDLEGFDQTIQTQSKEIEILKEKAQAVSQLKQTVIDLEKQLEAAKAISSNEIKQKIEIESLKDKAKVLNSSFDKEKLRNEQLQSKVSLLELQIQEANNSLGQLSIKYNNLMDENEINNKNLKKNFQLEKQIKELTDELQDMKAKCTEIEEYKSFKIVNEAQTIEINDLKDKINKSIDQQSMLNKSIGKLKEENFNKFETINSLENELRLKKLQINEKNTEIDALKDKIKNINLMNEEHETQLRLIQSQYELRIKDLKKEIEAFIDKTVLLEKENTELKKETENYKHISSLAKSNKEALTKKDFSILETMSRRVEELQELNGILKCQLSELTSNYNSLHKDKIYLQSNIYALLREETLLSKKQLEKIELSSEEMFANKKVINEVLLDSIITQKKENSLLKQQLAEITIECNKIMRNQSK